VTSTLRFAVLIVLAGVSVLAPRQALAEAEFCPARVSVYDFNTEQATLHSLELTAESERRVSANIIVQTDKGWYVVQAINSKIERDVAHMQTSSVKFDRVLYHSEPLYFRLPAGETTTRAWVTDAFSNGDAVFGWDAKGDVTCLPDPGGDATTIDKGDPPTRVNAPARSMFDLPSSGDTILEATPIEQPASYTACAKPFSPAVVTHALPPDYPAQSFVDANITVKIAVAIGSNGSLVDAWIYQPSGILDMDLAALKAAQMSRYAGATALCAPAPGVYLFRAVFSPD